MIISEITYTHHSNIPKGMKEREKERDRVRAIKRDYDMESAINNAMLKLYILDMDQIACLMFTPEIKS